MTERIKTCTKCGQKLSLSHFYKHRKSKDGHAWQCRDCCKKRYRKNHKKNLEYASRYRNSEKGKKNRLEYYKNTKNEKAKKTKIRRQKLRLRVLETISSTLKCKRCDIDDVRVLTIDHINNDGSDERKKVSDIAYYIKILGMEKNDIKKQYRVLCRNCNWIKRLESGRWTVFLKE